MKKRRKISTIVMEQGSHNMNSKTRFTILRIKEFILIDNLFILVYHTDTVIREKY